MKIFSSCFTNFFYLNRGGVVLYLYLKPTKKESIDEKWSKFIKKITVEDDTWLKSLNSNSSSNDYTWENAIDELRLKLKKHWDSFGLDDINDNLVISLFDNDKTKLDGPLNKRTIKKINNITIELKYKNKNNLKEKIENVNIKGYYSSLSDWFKFIEEITANDNRIIKNYLSNAIIIKKTIWKEIVNILKLRLKTDYQDKYKLINFNNLEIEIFDENDKEVDYKYEIGKKYLHKRKVHFIPKMGLFSRKKIVISDFQIKRKIRLNYFINSITPSHVENLLEHLKDNLSSTDTWNDVLVKIKKHINNAWGKLDENDLDVEDLDISLINIKDLNATIDNKYIKKPGGILKFIIKDKKDYLNNKNLILINYWKFQLSEKARWNEFVKSIKDANNQLLDIDLKDKFGLTNSWDEVVTKLKKQLKDRLSKFDLLDSELDISFDDYKNLSETIDAKYKKANDLKITLSYKKFQEKPKLNIKDFQISEQSRWLAFLDSIKDTNNQLLGIDLTDKFDLTNSWSDVKTKIKELLENKLDEYGLLDSELGISFDEYKELSAKIDAKYKKANDLKITLSYKKFQEKPKLNIKDFQISEQARWLAFIESIKGDNNQLLGIDLTDKFDLTNSWSDVKTKIKELLKNKLDEYGLLDSELGISFDEYKELSAKIDAKYKKANNLDITLIYKEFKEKPELIIKDFQISEQSRWLAFIDSIKDTNNQLLDIDLKDKFGLTNSWDEVVTELKKQLKDRLSEFDLLDSELGISFDDYKNLSATIDDEYKKANDLKITLSYKEFKEKPELIIKDFQISEQSRWLAFINQFVSDKILSKIQLDDLGDDLKWSDILAKIKKELQAKYLKDYDLDLNNLTVSLVGKDPNEPFNNLKPGDLEIEIKHKTFGGKEKLTIKDLQLSEKARWNAFMNSISKDDKLNDLSLTDFTNKNKWDDLLKVIREKLVKEFNKVFDNKTDLLLELLDLNKQKLVLNNQIGKDLYFPKWNIKVKLTHKQLGDNDSKSLDLVINTPLDLNELKSIVDTLLRNIINNNKANFKTNFIKELNKPDSKYKHYKFEESDFKFDFKSATEGDNKVSVTITSNNEDKVKGEVQGSGGDYDKFKLDLNNLKNAIEKLIEKEKPTSLEAFVELIKQLLKTDAYKKYKIDIEKELVINFEKPEFGQKGSWSIGIKRKSPNVINPVGKQNINVYDHFLFDLSDAKYGLNDFIKELLEKVANNDKETFVNAFIDKLNKIEGFENKFEKTDFNFAFKPAEEGDNKVSVTITSNNEDKVKGEVKGSGGDYDKFKLDLNNLKDAIEKLIEKEKPTSLEAFVELIKQLLEKDAYKKYKIDIEKELEINFEKPEFGKKGSWSIGIKRKSPNVINPVGKQNINVYDHFLFDLSDAKYGLNDFIKELLEKVANNNKDTFITAFIDKLNNIEGFENKFEKIDFNFAFKPAEEGDNKVSITITSNNEDKVKGEVKGSGGDYDKFKLDLNNLKDAIEKLIEKEKPTSLEAFVELIKQLLEKDAYKKYKIDIEKELEINFEKPEFGKKGSWSIGIKRKSPNVINPVGKQNINVYDHFLFDLSDAKYGLNDFIKELLEKVANNNKDTFITAFIDKLNKIEGFENKFEKTDFNFAFKPAEEGDNKVSITITSNNEDKVKGEVKGSGGDYDKFKLDLNNLKDAIEKLIEKEKPTSLEAFVELIKQLLEKDAYKKYKIDIEKELEINFEKPEFGKKGSWSIGIKRKSPNVINPVAKQNINVYDHFLFDLSDAKYGLNDFIKELLEKVANNNKDTFITAFIDKLNKIEGFENKFEKIDFNFAFKPAEEGDNKVSITITSNNEDKVKGEVKGSGGDYDKFKLDLNNLKDAIEKLIEKEKPTSLEAFVELIKQLLEKDAYKKYKIDIEKELEINFEKPEFGKKGNFKIKSKKGSSNTIGEVFEKEIAVYKSLLLDLDQLKNIVKNLLQDVSNNDATKFKNKFLDEINKIDKFKNKFNINDFENDFYFNFEPATKKENLLKVTITARNYDKVIGQIKESDSYDKYRINLNDLIKDIKDLINENQPDNQEVLEKLLQTYFDSKYKDYVVNISNDITIEFTPPELGDPTPGKLTINSNNDKKFKNKLDITIPYYDKYKIDFNQFKNLLEDKIEDKKPNDLNDLKNIIEELLKQDFNRYANQNKITISDLGIDFNLEKPIKTDSKLKITISLKQHSKFKTKNEFKFTLSSTPEILDQWNKFSDELKKDNTWASLKHLLEKDKKYKSWDQVVKIIKEWLEAKYAKKYNQIFKDTKLKISLWQDGNNNTLTRTIEPKKEIDIKVLIDLEKEGFFSFTTWYIPLSFKMNLKSLLDEYANKIEKETVGDITYKLDYEDNPHFFIQDLKEKIKAFFEKNKFYNKTIDYKFLDEANLKFIVGINNISINLTYLGIDKEVKLKLVNKKLDLSKYKNIGLIDFFVDPIYDETAFGVVYIKDDDIIRKFVEKIKKEIPEFKNIDVDRYVKYFKLKSDYPITAHNTKERIYTLDFICSLTNVEGKFENVKIDVRKKTIHLEKLALKFLSEQLRDNKELFELNQIVDYKFHFDENGYKSYYQIEEQYRDMISNKLDSILKDEKLWFAKIFASKNLRNDFGFYNFNFNSFTNFNFWENELRMMIGYSYPDVLDKDNDFKSEGIEFTNPLKIDIISSLISGDVDAFYRKVDKKKQNFHYWTKESSKEQMKSVTGLMTTDPNDWMNVKKFIDDEIFRNITLDRENIHYDKDLSSSKNGYFYYVKDKNAVVNVFVDSYNNDGSYKKTPKHSFNSGKITINVGYINHFNEIKKSSIYNNWTWVTKEYNLVNKIEYEWWGEFKKRLDNESNKSNHWRFSKNKLFTNILDYIYNTNIVHDVINKWDSIEWTRNERTHYFDGDWMVFHFALKRKNSNDESKESRLYYSLKLGGTGDINKIISDPTRKLPNRDIGRILKDYTWGKIDLKFRLHKMYDNGDDKLLSIGKDEKYIMDTY